ncbi:uroporphyrinogen decarboxylase family protein [Clostridium sp. WILCCON 0269]|uniref:Uroporphyrinogen decarboxylase family protein n=1 Tax=Candidatus Clostridium eludens TaxID=3381663 RepID=A0ABW8SIN0_9CLOT
MISTIKIAKGGSKVEAKEIVKRALKREKTPRIPVTILSGGAWCFNSNGYSLKEALEMEPKAAANIIIETNEKVNSDIVWAASGYNNLIIGAIGGKLNFREKGVPDIVEPLIKDLSHVDKLDLSGIGEDKGIQNLLKVTEILKDRIGDKTMIGVSQWGPLTLAGQIVGIEKLMMGMIKDKQAVKELIDFTSELCYRYLALFVDAGVEIVSMSDMSASGDMISKKFFEEFAIPCLTKVTDKIKKKKADIYIMTHICGDVTKFLDLYPTIGVDLVSLDAKVDLSKAREVLHGKMAFGGNMGPVDVMKDSTPEGVKKACSDCIKKSGEKEGYVMMPGCDLPPDTPLENVKAMVEAAHNYKF